MRRTTISKATTRIGASAVIVAFVATITALPAAAGTPPNVSGFTPTSGPVGTVVTINGTNFAGATQVRFNAASTPFSVNGAGTQITASVPASATDGPISVTNLSGTGVSGSDFNAVVKTEAPRIQPELSPNARFIDNVPIRSLNQIFRRKMVGNRRLSRTPQNVCRNEARKLDSGTRNPFNSYQIFRLPKCDAISRAETFRAYSDHCKPRPFIPAF